MSILRGNQRHKSNFIVTAFILFITACYVGLLYTQIKQEFDAAEAYAVHPWGAAFSPTGAPAPSVAPQGTLPSSSSPHPTYRFRSGGISNMPSGGGVRGIRVPVPSRGAGFRVYNNAGASGTSYAFRPASGSAGGSASSITLTSDAVLHSYGGGNAAGSSMQGASSQNRSSQATSTGGSSLSAPVLTVSLPTYTLAYTPSTSLTADPDQQAAAAAMASAQWQQHTGFSGSGAIFSSHISNPYRTVNGVSSFLSADEYLAYSNGSPTSSRYRAPGTNVDPIERWLQSLIEQGLGGYTGETDGTYYFDLATLKAYYEALIADNNMPTFTWEEILNWFNGQVGTKKYDFNPLPVGEPWVLLILAALYAVYLLWRRSPRFDQ